jgi:hypothetical protein
MSRGLGALKSGYMIDDGLDDYINTTHDESEGRYPSVARILEPATGIGWAGVRPFNAC